MLMPFEFAVLTLDEARLLKDFIRKATAVSKMKSTPEELAILFKLDEFVARAQHYENVLTNISED